MRRWHYVLAGMLLGSVLTGASAVLSRDFLLQDPVKQSPNYYRILLENDDVRVLEYRLKPGEREPMHSHTDGVVYGFNDSKIRSTLPNGTVTESEGKAGDVFWRKSVTHALENIGDSEVHSLAVEIKRR